MRKTTRVKTAPGSTQAQAAMLSALDQVAELAHELCRPDYSEVDKAIGRYLLETVRPVMQERAVGQDPPTMLSLGLRLSRLFGRRRDPVDKQPNTVPQNVGEHARAVATEYVSEHPRAAVGDCVTMDSFGDAPDPRYEIEERASHVAVH